MLKKPRRHFLILSCFQYNLESVNWTIAFGIQLMRGRFLLSSVFFSWNIADSMTCFRHYLPIIDRQPWRLWSMLIYCDLHPFNTRKNLAARCAFGIFVSLITTIMTYSFISNRGNCHFGIAHIYLTVYKSKVPFKRSKRSLMLVSIRTMILNKNNNRLNRKRRLPFVYRKRLICFQKKK